MLEYDYTSNTGVQFYRHTSNPWKKVAVISIVTLFIIFILIAGAMLYFLFYDIPDKPFVSKPNTSLLNPTIQDSKSAQGQISYNIEPDYLTYILNELGAYKLHDTPISKEQPFIGFVVDDTNFVSSIDDNEIKTIESQIGTVDLIFYTTAEEVIKSIDSENIGESFKESINSGSSSFEVISDKQTLFLKGYLELYKTLTGEEISLE